METLEELFDDDLPTLKPVESPFISGTDIQWAWDSTSLGDFKRCARLYYYTMIEGWVPRDESVHLRFGILYHTALQNYDIAKLKGATHEDATVFCLRELLIESFDFVSDHKSKTREGLIRTVIWYLEKFRDDNAKTIARPDGTPAVEVSFRFPLPWGPKPDVQYFLCGHLDRVVKYGRDTYVMDRKTTTFAPNSYYFQRYEPDNQMSLYSFAGQIILNTPVKGVIVDAAQIKENATEFGRGFTLRTKGQIKEWIDSLNYWFELQARYAALGVWPMNDTSCDKYGGCKFREICNKDPSVRDKFLHANFTQLPKEDRWNPLRSR